VDALELAGSERVLEIGCGPGVTASLVCERLDGGTLLAIDRSAKAISQASRRNAAHVEAGRAEFRSALPEALDGAFERVFSMNVRELWESPERVLRLRAPDGVALFAFQLPSWTQAEALARTAPLAEALRARGDDVEVLIGEAAFAVRSRG
jgi:trans-aconitate methyltransferase